ncbi:MAG TPA: iron ABC transporter permease [Bacteroidales bacterium]|nr:iron ABC transporter permease [Bacteroidales bacterium]
MKSLDNRAETNMIFPRKRLFLIFLLLFLLLFILFSLDLFLGSVYLSPGEVIKALFSESESYSQLILLKFRLPKALTALLVGAGLSLSGLQMQTVFRNPLAGPDVLGITSGASLGVAFVILGFSFTMPALSISGLGNWILVAAAWAGAGLVMMLILVLATRIKDIMTILILGIMLSSGISAIVILLQYFSSESLLKSYVIWTMGSLGNLTSGQLLVLAISVAAGIVLSLFSSKMLNALLLGESYAGSIGLNVKFARIIIFLCTSILAGSVTAFCGPVGFIGIAVPHIARIMFRTSDHKVLIPGTLLIGGSVLLFSDIVAQLPGSEKVLPLNAVTSLIGIPVVIWVIMNNRKYTGIY